MRAKGGSVSDCPLVRLAQHRKILKTLEQTGMVALPMNQWLRFFEALEFISREHGRQEIYCAILVEHIVFSKTPLKRKVEIRPEQIELFDG
jgi:hypothetical protein